MANNRAEFTNDPNKKSLLDIPGDVLVYIARKGMIDVQACASLSKSCRTLHRFFSPTLKGAGAAILLRAMVHCDFVMIRRIVSANPEIIFAYANVQELNGAEICITPLKFALRNRAWYSINIFKNALKTDEQKVTFEKLCNNHFPSVVDDDRKAPLFSDEEKQAAQPFLDLVSAWLNDETKVSIDDLLDFLFEQSVALSTPSCFSLQPGFWAYLALQTMFTAHENNINPDIITYAKIDDFINFIVKAALENLFPREMLAQLLAAEDDDKHHWTLNSTFPETNLPENWMFVRNGNIHEVAYIPIFKNNDLYRQCVLEEIIWRGNSREACIGPLILYAGEMILEVRSILNDVSILKHLANVREEQLSRLCQPQLLESPVNSALLSAPEDSAEESLDSAESVNEQRDRTGCNIF